MHRTSANTETSSYKTDCAVVSAIITIAKNASKRSPHFTSDNIVIEDFGAISSQSLASIMRDITDETIRGGKCEYEKRSPKADPSEEFSAHVAHELRETWALKSNRGRISVIDTTIWARTAGSTNYMHDNYYKGSVENLDSYIPKATQNTQGSSVKGQFKRLIMCKVKITSRRKTGKLAHVLTTMTLKE
ncbi:hypothetical protein SARC_03918 [Sphaeroforma arctica JP610]|uniref:Uncharacterized protein n=1 Tax=Sphaeroforma arctica JP610 TaxID=667725 RepID=A0A0L0G454_9EUKA|nr:hypothetical protein SARC_03918 [Sphaeroforma arctica JP610]KNC83835.1 hypothetical protein SARC_03918 [Sphaeroforma arctica JP610]|eukprot:XP_014157737.1 hypothetical protein SARC_03918 [Sphaeroforma arctica JP610]